jgi:hypothetical protein
MIHLLPVIDASTTPWSPWKAAPRCSSPSCSRCWRPLANGSRAPPTAPGARWTALHEQIDRLQPGAAALDQRAELLLSNALYRLTEWADLWQDCCTLQHALRTDDAKPWRAVSATGAWAG